MSTNKSSIIRRLTAAALCATVLATGAVISGGAGSTAGAGDGPPRCCYKSTP